MHHLIALMIFACAIALLVAYCWWRDTHRPSDPVADKIWHHVCFGEVKMATGNVEFRLPGRHDICISLWDNFIRVDGRDIADAFSYSDRAAIFYRAGERLSAYRRQRLAEACGESEAPE